jgi:hypothetical protein
MMLSNCSFDLFLVHVVSTKLLLLIRGGATGCFVPLQMEFLVFNVRDIVSLKQGTFELDCQQIDLVQNIVPNPKSYHGPGTIRENDKGELTVKIHTTSVQHTDMFQNLRGQLAGQSGTIVEEGEYFTLTARDYGNHLWTARRILPRSSWHAAGLVMTKGSLDFIERAGPLDGDNIIAPHYLRLHFFDSVAIPCTAHKDLGVVDHDSGQRNFAEFRVANLDFKMFRLADEFVVHVTSEQSFSEFLETNILEALQFILARSLRPRVVVRGQNGTISTQLWSAGWKCGRTRLDPPIEPGRPESNASSWRLFGQYLEYVIRVGTSDFWHPCSAHLHNACEASANSMEAWAVGMSVAVEGISTLLNANVLSCEEKADVARLRKLVKIWTKCRRWRQPLVDRALGLLSQLDNARVKDRLAPLEASGKVDAAHVKSWSLLRNRGVHARHFDPLKVSMAELQGVLSLLTATTVLMYHITFHLIGCEGECTDYSTINFPTKQYPFPITEETPQQ